ncbi:MAG: hypothetical protein K0U41_09935 [Gammaproteobacteria bacterium]|nr:hypothetical protein [Gammaproteobacteria bacterium]
MFNRHDLQQSVIDVIERIEGKPNNMNYPNDPSNSPSVPYATVAFINSFQIDQLSDGPTLNNDLITIDIITKKGEGTKEMNGYISAFLNALHPAIVYSGFRAISIPDVVILGEDSNGYRANLTLTVQYLVTAPKPEPINLNEEDLLNER